jgi:hypothetical protein
MQTGLGGNVNIQTERKKNFSQDNQTPELNQVTIQMSSKQRT